MKNTILYTNNTPTAASLVQRLAKPTPPFFKKVRMAGLMLAAAGGSLLAAPVALPAAVVALAGYLAVAGSVMTAVAQAAVDSE